MRSAFYFLYLTIALVSAKCNPPPYTAGLTLETGVFMDGIADNMEPEYSCECDVGVRYFWDSSNTPVPYDAGKLISIKTGTYNDCKNLCIRSEEGICYTPATPYVNIYFIPYCKYKKCHVYTIMNSPSNFMYGNLLREEGSGRIYQSPNYTTNMKPESGYIKADAISCNGCKNIQVAPKCYKQASECMAPPDTVGLTFDSNSYGSALQFTVPPIAKCQCINGVRYFWKAITPNVTTSVDWAYDNKQLAMNIMSDFICESFCICDEAGECYQKFNDKSASYIKFIPYCSGKSCHMYAVVYDEREIDGYSPLKTLHGKVYRRKLGSTFDDSLIKAYSVTCNGCGYIYKKSICQGPTYIKKPGEIMERYPYFEYFDTNLGLLNMPDVLTQEIIDLDWSTAFAHIQFNCDIYATADEGEYNTWFDLCENVSVGNYSNLKTNATNINIMLDSSKIETDLMITNLYILYSVGSVGIVASISIFFLIFFIKDLRTPYGTLCAILSIADLLFIIHALAFEGGYTIYQINTGMAHYFLFGQYLDSYILYIHITLSITGSIVSCMQSMNRTIALYLPILYAHRFKNKHMLLASLISFLLIFFICLPILFLEVDLASNYSIDAEFIVPQHMGLLYIYFVIYVSTDYVMILISFLFNSATAFKLAKFFKNQPDGWTRQKLQSELIILIQNFMNVVFFMLTMLPYLLYVTFCGYYEFNCYDTVFHRLIILLHRFNSNRVIWRSCEELFALMIQFRIYRRERKELKTPTIPIKQKLTVLEKIKRKIKGNSAAPIMK